jgi:very-short-patch-repair endonuclease
MGQMTRSAVHINMEPGKKILTPPNGTQGDVECGKRILTPPDGTPLLPKERGRGEVVALARQLRRKQTPAEQILWECLRDRRLAGLKFRRQHPIDKFIADFYCHEARLVVEVDGAVHREKNQAERDALRTEVLRQFGLSVVRVTNTEVETALRKVLTRIVRAAQAGK